MSISNFDSFMTEATVAEVSLLIHFIIRRKHVRSVCRVVSKLTLHLMYECVLCVNVLSFVFDFMLIYLFQQITIKGGYGSRHFGEKQKGI